MPRFQRISFKKPFGFQSSFSSDYARQTQCEKSMPAGNPRSRGGAHRFPKGLNSAKSKRHRTYDNLRQLNESSPVESTTYIYVNNKIVTMSRGAR